jgi:hypothetical protein
MGVYPLRIVKSKVEKCSKAFLVLAMFFGDAFVYRFWREIMPTMKNNPDFYYNDFLLY